MIDEFFRISFKSIKNKGLRSWLTVFGIVIGIAAIVSLISLGQGLKDAINQQFSILGPNLIYVQPGGSFGPMSSGGTSKLTDHDIRVVKSVAGVELAAGMIAKNAKIKFRDEIVYATTIGIDSGDAQDILLDGTGIKIEKGSKFKDTDTWKAAVTYDYWNGKVFDQPVKIGDKISVNDKVFEVTAFIGRIGNPDDDSTIYMPLESAQELFGVKDDYMVLMVRTKDNYDTKVVAEKIKEKMRRDRSEKKGEESFNIYTLEDIRSSVGIILDAVQAIVIGIACISLVVGGVGIMNSMYTSVLERTREIGVMKAIGARNSAITQMFLIESGIIGMIGGILGCLLGAAMSKTVEYIAVQALDATIIQAALGPELIIGSILFSFIVGCVSGVLPARQAASLNPVEALRYE
jgi:putative ABC transport system permease protein